jgi:hypothetical protein
LPAKSPSSTALQIETPTAAGVLALNVARGYRAIAAAPWPATAPSSV